MQDIPHRSNFYGTLDTTLSRRRIAELYLQSGWDARKCGWKEYEIRCSFADLVIESASPILIHGLVNDVITNSEEILAPLRQAGVNYAAECYSEGREFLMDFRSRFNRQ